MDAFALAGLSLAVIGLVVLVVFAIVTGVRIVRVNRGMRMLAAHPAMVALQGASSLSTRYPDLGERIALAKERARRIGGSVALLLAASVALRSDVDRIAATTLELLRTFMPNGRSAR